MAKILKKKKKLFGKSGKGGETETAIFEEQRVKYNQHRKNINNISHDVKKYQKSVKAIIQPLQQLAASLVSFYEDSKGEYSRCGTQFASSSDILVQCISDFEMEIEKLLKELDEYSEKLSSVKKAISERDKLLSDYHNKQKNFTSSEKKDSVKTEALKEKYISAKEAFEEANESLINELTQLNENRCSDFDTYFKSLVQSQMSLFARAAKAFEPIHGTLSIPSRKTKPKEEIPILKNRTELTPPSSPENSPREYEQVSVHHSAPPPRPAKPNLSPQINSPSLSSPPGPRTENPYIIPKNEREKYSAIFRREDPDFSGFIDGEKAFVLFSRSGLSHDILAQIWEISDQDKDGRLTPDEFLIAMFLINSKLSGRISQIPDAPPPELQLNRN